MTIAIQRLVNTRFHGNEQKRKFIASQWPHSRVEEVSNTSTVALRLVGGDKKGSLKYETVKYGHESHRTRIRECAGEGQQQL
jgi:hypothetical protein